MVLAAASKADHIEGVGDVADLLEYVFLEVVASECQAFEGGEAVFAPFEGIGRGELAAPSRGLQLFSPQVKHVDEPSVLGFNKAYHSPRKACDAGYKHLFVLINSNYVSKNNFLITLARGNRMLNHPDLLVLRIGLDPKEFPETADACAILVIEVLCI